MNKVYYISNFDVYNDTSFYNGPMPPTTDEDACSCIDKYFPVDHNSPMSVSVNGITHCYYELARLDGKSVEDAFRSAIDQLSEKVTEVFSKE